VTACFAYLRNHMAKYHQILPVDCGVAMARPSSGGDVMYFRFCGWRPVFTLWLQCVVCIPMWPEHNSWSSCVDSSHILLNHKDQQVYIVGCRLGQSLPSMIVLLLLGHPDCWHCVDEACCYRCCNVCVCLCVCLCVEDIRDVCKNG